MKRRRRTNQSGFIGVRNICEQVSVGGGFLLKELAEEELVAGGGFGRRRIRERGHRRPQLGLNRMGGEMRRGSNDGGDSEEIQSKHFSGICPFLLLLLGRSNKIFFSFLKVVPELVTLLAHYGGRSEVTSSMFVAAISRGKRPITKSEHAGGPAYTDYQTEK